jgi:hypothetical protein
MERVRQHEGAQQLRVLERERLADQVVGAVRVTAGGVCSDMETSVVVMVGLTRRPLGCAASPGTGRP